MTRAVLSYKLWVMSCWYNQNEKPDAVNSETPK